MKIAVESDTLANGVKTGVHHYVQHIVAALARLDSTKQYNLVYFGTPHKLDKLFTRSENLSYQAISWFPRKLYNLFLRTPIHIPIDLFLRSTPDLFFFPNFVRWPLARTKKSVVVIYDTAFLDFPSGQKTQHHRLYLSKKVPTSIKRSDHVITISENTKQALIKHYQTDPSKISVATPAIDHEQFKPLANQTVERYKQSAGIIKPYILYFGSFEPRKNIPGLIEAYMALPDNLRQQYQLVLAGGESWKSEEIESALSKVPKENLIRLGFVEDADLPTLYNGATIYVLASIYEGWGMPILEAQACGTPVLTTDNTSLPEAGGRAAQYARTGDQADLNTKLAQLLAQPKQLEQMRQEGIKHAATFSWDKSAKRILEIFDSTYKVN